MLTDYVPHHCKPVTGEDYGRLARLHIKPHLGQVLISEITRTDIITFHHAPRDKPYIANLYTNSASAS